MQSRYMRYIYVEYPLSINYSFYDKCNCVYIKVIMINKWGQKYQNHNQLHKSIIFTTTYCNNRKILFENFAVSFWENNIFK